jgi:uncharacterized SAM-binding protein YcdF (DUF218 family)
MLRCLITLKKEYQSKNKENEMIKIAFVPTAGVRVNVFWKNHKLPNVFSWSILKWAYRRFGLRSQPLNSLKEETVARLEKTLELYRKGIIDKIFLTGGQKTRSVEMMREWLLRRGLKSRVIICDPNTLQTGDGAAVFSCLSSAKEIWEVHIVTSWYHIWRTKKEIRRSLKSALVISHPVFPPLTSECLMREYLYNIFTEPAKIILSVSLLLKGWYRKKEKEARSFD